ncbi:MAG: pantoate--beta-alanine ligase [bacterium]|nr:pantoate--beta-alanine ligase [bacterium]
MQVLESISALRALRRALRGSVGVVLTMGALHEGHIALVRAARAENDFVLATIFVNPLQFGAGEDLDKYPRDLPRDLAMFERAGVDAVFTPTPALMYPPGFQTMVRVEHVTQGLEGARRPRHFDGVATVVAKLFNLTQPDAAYFGQKDAQQVVVIKRMVRDLDFPIRIVVCPTQREPDGLAMSSRNVYLSPDQRARASSLYRGLLAAASAYDRGVRDPESLMHAVETALDPAFTIEYIRLNDPVTLVTVEQATHTPMLLSLAARLGSTTLIDNLLLPFALNDGSALSEILGG